MKKTLLLAGIAGLLFAQTAQAETIKPVVGLDYVYSYIDMNDGLDEFVENKLNAFALSAGAKFNKYFGIEAFYQQSEKAEKTKVFYPYYTETSFRYKAYGVDLVGYLPLQQNFDLIGTVGGAYYDAKLSVLGESDSEKKFGFRLGAGAQHNINEHISLRLMGKYNYTNIDGAKNMFDITAGARFYF